MDTFGLVAVVQWFGFKLLVRASRVAKILELCSGSVLQLRSCSFSSAQARNIYIDYYRPRW